MFIVHQGKETIAVFISGETRNSKNPLHFVGFGRDVTKMMQEKIIDKSLSGWLIPDFSTTTEIHCVIASIVFISAMSKYFYPPDEAAGCGLPSVTLM